MSGYTEHAARTDRPVSAPTTARGVRESSIGLRMGEAALRTTAEDYLPESCEARAAM